MWDTCLGVHNNNKGNEGKMSDRWNYNIFRNCAYLFLLVANFIMNMNDAIVH